MTANVSAISAANKVLSEAELPTYSELLSLVRAVVRVDEEYFAFSGPTALARYEKKRKAALEKCKAAVAKDAIRSGNVLPGADVEPTKRARIVRKPDGGVFTGADSPPEGYRLAHNSRTITERDMVYWPATSQMDAMWKHPRSGENVLGASVNDCWPRIMGVATPIAKGNMHDKA